jgi:hypothetical protein
VGGTVVGTVVGTFVGSVVGTVVGSGVTTVGTVGGTVGSMVGSVTGTIVGDVVVPPPSAATGMMTMAQNMHMVSTVSITEKDRFTISLPLLVDQENALFIGCVLTVEKPRFLNQGCARV